VCGTLLTVVGIAGFLADAHFDSTHRSFIPQGPRHDDHAAGTGRGF
jgi:hypothetical protein